MCTEPNYAIRLKTEYDLKFKRFGIRTPIKVLKSVKEIGKDLSKLNYDHVHYDLIMTSCGQCMECRLLRVKQRAVMCMCESLEHEENSFVTLTFGYPQTYSYYRHTKGLSHYIASKKAHFHEWSLDVETFQKFMKRLRQWYYNYQLTDYLIKHGYSDFVYKKCFNKYTNTEYYKVKSHIRIPKNIKDEVLKDFKPNIIRFMHCGEYGSKNTHRAHHHVILHGFQFPDIEPIYEKGQTYYVSEILSKLWPFGIHRIGKCEYNSCCYVARYVTKKLNGNDKIFYNGKKPEYATYSTKPVLGYNYACKNYKEFATTGVVSVVTDKKYECPLPKSYDNIVKKMDIKLFNSMKEQRVKNCKKDLDVLLNQKRSIYSKLDSKSKIAMSTLKKLVRGYEESGDKPEIDEYIKKAKAFGVSTKFFSSEFSDNAISLLNKKSFKDHRTKSSNSDIHDNYYKFELARKRHISACYNVNHSDKRVISDLCFFINMPNPFKCVSRGRSMPDIESINENSAIDDRGSEVIYD